MTRLFDNQCFYINYISDEILSRLNDDEKIWLNLLIQRSLDIEAGPKLKYSIFNK